MPLSYQQLLLTYKKHLSTNRNCMMSLIDVYTTALEQDRPYLHHASQ